MANRATPEDLRAILIFALAAADGLRLADVGISIDRALYYLDNQEASASTMRFERQGWR